MLSQENPHSYLTEDEISNVVIGGLETLRFDNQRVLVIIPDGTRTMPMPLMFRLLKNTILQRTNKLEFLVALGTHQPMNDEQLTKLVGIPVVNGKAENIPIHNHHWDNPDTFAHIGTIPSREIEQLSSGLLVQDVPVHLNRLLTEVDQIIICGPVFPHEVVGFSGGNKYLFPGVAGAEIINFTHWLGALITSFQIIGTPQTPVRAVINRAAAFLDKPISCFSLVVTHDGTSGIYFGSPQEAWGAAVKMSQQKHIHYVSHPFNRILSIMPDLYDDLWTGAKGMYKVEPAIADGGEVVIFAPRITEVSYTHGSWLDQIGYHTRDYFVKQWDLYKNIPWGILAHSTHLKGMGTFDADTRIELPRIQVTLATSIPEDRCRKLNLNYMDPTKINMEEWRNKESQGIMVIPRAGEMLYKLK